MATPLYTESNLIGTVDRTIAAADTTIYIRFRDRVTGDSRAPQSSTKIFTLEPGSPSNPSANWETIICTSHSTSSGVTTLTGCTRAIASYGTSVAGGTGLTHAAGVEAGCVDVHLLWNILVSIIDGTAAFPSTIDMGTHKILNLDTPTASTDGANKAYVDLVAGGVSTLNKVVVDGTAGETVAAGNLVYLKASDNRWWLTDADTAATVENVTLGIAQGAGTAGNSVSGGVLIYGIDTNQTGLTANTKYFASNTAGGLSSSAGTVEVSIGMSLSTTSILFCPRFDQDITEDIQDALVGTSGTPSGSNKYVTSADVDTAATASKIVRRLASGDVTVPSSPTNATDAISKTWAESNLGTKVGTSTTGIDTHSTTGEQTLMSVAIPANTLSTNNAVRALIYVSDFDLANGATITLRLKYGSTTIATTTIGEDGGTSFTNFGGKIEAEIRAAGATNSQKGNLFHAIGSTNAAAAASDLHPFVFSKTGTATEDSTGALNLIVTAEMSSSSTGIGLVTDGYSVERLRA